MSMTETEMNLSEFGEVEHDQQQAAPVETVDQRQARLEAELGQVRNSIERQQQSQPALNQLLGDPVIAAYVAAKANGQQMTLAPLQPAQPEKEEVIDWNTIAPEQLPMKIAEYVERRAETRASKMVSERLQPVVQRQQQMQSVFEQQNAQKVVATINDLRAKNPDFEKHRATMLQIHNETGGNLDPASLLILARARNGQPAPVDEVRTTASERPTNSAARPPARAIPQGQLPPAIGHAGWKESLARVLASNPVPKAI